MTTVVEESFYKRFEKEIKKAVTLLGQEKVLVLPTDTCYGLCADATKEESVYKIYLIKERKIEQPIHILVSDIAMAERYVEISKKVQNLLERFSTGLFQKPLTLILPRKKFVPKGIQIISAGTGFLGIRISNDRVTREILSKFGKPLTASSANPAGQPPPFSIEKARSLFKDKKFQPDFCFNQGTLVKTPSSTIVQIEDDNIQVLREGLLKKEEVFSFLKNI